MQISDAKAGIRVIFLDGKGSKIVEREALGSHHGIIAGKSAHAIYVTVDSPGHPLHAYRCGIFPEALEPAMTNQDALFLLKKI